MNMVTSRTRLLARPVLGSVGVCNAELSLTVAGAGIESAPALTVC